MNHILLLIVAVIVLLLVFVMFSLDDREDDDDESPEVDSEPTPRETSEHAQEKAQEKAHEDKQRGGAAPPASTSASTSASASISASISASAPTLPASKLETTPSGPLETVRAAVGTGRNTGVAAYMEQAKAAVGSENDLRFRVLLEDLLPPPTAVNPQSAIIACLQLRFSEDAVRNVALFHQVLARAEEILQAEHTPFPPREYLAGQFSRLWVFLPDEERDDAVFEAMVDVDDVVNRFRRNLGQDDLLLSAKAVITAGIAKGEVWEIQRGQLSPPGFAGPAVFLAESLAEAARDFQVYVDAEMHRQAQSLFDFREWKPVKLRSPLPAVPFFEVVGWNKRDEIFAGAGSPEIAIRKAVAVVYRYLEFSDLSPLIGLLSDPDEKVALETLKTIEELGDERALGILKKILPETQNTILRSAIIDALGGIGKEEVVPVLLAASKDTNWQVRFSAAGALHRICGAEAMKHVTHLEQDEDGAVRAAFHRIMFLHTRKNAHLDTLTELLTDLSHRARKAATEALLEIATEHALFAVVAHFYDQEPELRRHTLRLLIGCRSPVLYACFLKLFQTADGRSKADIVTAVRRARIVS